MTIIDELTDVLTEEYDIYGHLIDAARRKKNCVIKNRLAELNAVSNDENAAASRLSKLDRRRASLARDMATVLNIKDPDLTLMTIADNLKDGSERERLSGLAALIRAKISELRALNNENRALIENALQYIEFSINVIRGAVGGCMSADGRVETESQCLLDVRN